MGTTTAVACLPGPLVSWDAAVTAYLRSRRRLCTPATVAVYTSTLLGPRTREWISRHGITTTGAVTRAALEDLELGLADAGLRPATVHVYHRSIKALLRWAAEEGWPVDRGVLGLPAPTLPIAEPRTFSVAEIDALLSHCRIPRDRFLVRFLLGTGLRRAEAASVRVDDLCESPSGPWLRVRQGKGRKDRVVPLDSPRLALSREIRRYLRDVRPQSRSRELLLSLRQPHGPMGSNAIRLTLQRLGVEAGVVPTHAHRFRHTFASRALADGVDPLTLQRVLGHTRLEMTMRYVHFSADQLVRSWSEPPRR